MCAGVLKSRKMADRKKITIAVVCKAPPHCWLDRPRYSDIVDCCHVIVDMLLMIDRSECWISIFSIYGVVEKPKWHRDKRQPSIRLLYRKC